MATTYNEIDEYAARWIGNLTAAGHVAPGVVDTRSIAELTAEDVRHARQVHFFAGIAVWSAALRAAGWPDDAPIEMLTAAVMPSTTLTSAATLYRAHERSWSRSNAACKPPNRGHGPTRSNMVDVKSKSESVVVSSSLLSCTLQLDALKRAAVTMARVADAKSTMPILAYVAIRAFDDGVVLCATDLNVTATAHVAHHKGAPYATGGFAVPAKQLAATMKQLSDGYVTLSVRESCLVVSNASITSVIRGMPDRDCPKYPNDKDETLTWYPGEASELARLIDACEASVCKDETCFHLNGILYENPTGNRARMVSTDGHRLTRCDTIAHGALLLPSNGVIVPRKGATEISKMVAEGKRRKLSAVSMAIKGPHLFVRLGDSTIATKLIDAQFPPYEQVIPKECKILATFETKPLIAALKRAKLACSETRCIKLTLADRKLTLSSDNPDTGETKESLPMETLFDGTFAIGVSAPYMLDALDGIDCKHVTIGLVDVLDPILVRSTHDAVQYSIDRAPYAAIVMPMRI
jgi:DNA polymerase-3 subunit beta